MINIKQFCIGLMILVIAFLIYFLKERVCGAALRLVRGR